MFQGLLSREGCDIYDREIYLGPLGTISAFCNKNIMIGLVKNLAKHVHTSFSPYGRVIF